MKLILLIPTAVLMAISGYNLSLEFTKSGEPNYLIFKMLHLTVFLISLISAVAIIRSMFKIKYSEPVKNEDIQQHTYNTELKVIR
ncbi:hypothetical protein [Flavobacterium beibuense]|uniref:hypothetical protein n=1 Tax=Flavobacterium beibuense TaxID=657326 RepID=UPI003A90A267